MRDSSRVLSVIQHCVRR